MLLSGSLPFGLGETLDGTDSDGNLINREVLGKVYLVSANDIDANSRLKKRLSGRQLKVIALRNEAGITLFGKHVVRLTRTAGFTPIESVDGYADSLAEKGIVIVDEFLSSGGVADDDIFWGVIEGPVEILTPEAGAAFNGDISVGDQLVAATASTTGTSVAGRVSNVTLPGQTGATEAFKAAANMIGTALSARTTGETNSALLVNSAIRL